MNKKQNYMRCTVWIEKYSSVSHLEPGTFHQRCITIFNSVGKLAILLIHKCVFYALINA